MSTDEKQPGIETLRAAVDYFDWCRESFNWAEHDPFTVEELLAIYAYSQAHPADLDECADTWTTEQLADALRGVSQRYA